jgi:hypothetical protein
VLHIFGDAGSRQLLFHPIRVEQHRWHVREQLDSSFFIRAETPPQADEVRLGLTPERVAQRIAIDHRLLRKPFEQHAGRDLQIERVVTGDVERQVHLRVARRRLAHARERPREQVHRRGIGQSAQLEVGEHVVKMRGPAVLFEQHVQRVARRRHVAEDALIRQRPQIVQEVVVEFVVSRKTSTSSRHRIGLKWSAATRLIAVENSARLATD